ncbi:capistruin family lasso peptide [Burkholderia pseudomallei]|nr:capistruin family lasso peptide [Burkholderia pseudomallei]MBF3715718.1 capistruin family lasso peptide [Burkholderia pseudomallei]
MVQFLAKLLRSTIHGSHGVSLDAVSSTHGTPGFQTPDARVISRFGFN